MCLIALFAAFSSHRISQTMGSKKKKQEKRKDFVKQRLKVGKTAKAANHTDTSFKLKAISLPNQSVGEKSIQQYISLTKHHSPNTRKEVLIMLTKKLPDDPKLKQMLIKALIPMITDEDRDVRVALLDLFKVLIDTNTTLIEVNSNQLILYIHSAMNHISPLIHNGSVNFINLILEHFPSHIVKEHFVKTLDGFFNLLNWSKSNKKVVSSVSKKNLLIHLNGLKSFLQASLEDTDSSVNVHYNALTHLYAFPAATNPFSQLNLFNVLNSSSTDIINRKKIISETYKPWMEFNLNNLINDSPEVANISRSILEIIEPIH